MFDYKSQLEKKMAVVSAFPCWFLNQSWINNTTPSLGCCFIFFLKKKSLFNDKFKNNILRLSFVTSEAESNVVWLHCNCCVHHISENHFYCSFYIWSQLPRAHIPLKWKLQSIFQWLLYEGCNYISSRPVISLLAFWQNGCEIWWIKVNCWGHRKEPN